MKRVSLLLLSLAAFMGVQGAEQMGRAIEQYHQDEFSRSIETLDSLMEKPGLRFSDSLILLQYYGMNRASLGDAEAAREWFYRLLELDSLWQFPVNEKPVILEAFQQAQAMRKQRLDEQQQLPVSKPKLEPTLTFNQNRFQTPANPEGVSTGDRFVEINLLDGALPFGTGWMAKGRKKTGIAHGVIQTAGIIGTLYASSQIARLERDGKFPEEKQEADQWRQVLITTFSISLGSYLISIFTAIGENE